MSLPLLLFGESSLTLASSMLDRADELNGKHTLFGRVIGDTFFSKFHAAYIFSETMLTSVKMC